MNRARTRGDRRDRRGVRVRHRRCWHGIAAALAVLAGGGGCARGGAGDLPTPGGSVTPPLPVGEAGPAATTSPSGPPATTGVPATAPSGTAPPTDEEAVLATVTGYWDTWLAANNPPNPDHPDLERYMAGEHLTSVRVELTKRVAAQTVLEPREPSMFSSRAVVRTVMGTTATVMDCVTDDEILKSAVTGGVLNADVVTKLLEMSLTEIEGRWRVSLVRQLDKWPGVTDCAG